MFKYIILFGIMLVQSTCLASNLFKTTAEENQQVDVASNEVYTYINDYYEHGVVKRDYKFFKWTKVKDMDKFNAYLDAHQKTFKDGVSIDKIKDLTNTDDFSAMFIDSVHLASIPNRTPFYIWIQQKYANKPDKLKNTIMLLFVATSDNDEYFAERLTHTYPEYTMDEPSMIKYWRQLHSYREYLSVDRVDIDKSQEIPKVCIHFDSTIDESISGKDWLNKITINDKNLKGLTSKDGNDACFDGAWQTDYHIKIAKDLSNNAGPLVENYDNTIKVGDRDPMIRVVSKGNIFNAYNDQKIAVESVNAKRARIRLLHINVNNLSSVDVQTFLAGLANIDNYRLTSLADYDASTIFDGTVQLGGSSDAINKVEQTNIFLNDMVKQLKPGFYVLAVKLSKDKSGSSYSDEFFSDNGYRGTIIGFMVSDQGITSYTTEQGMWVEVRSLKDLSPSPNQKVKLFSKANEVLSTVTTDAKGLAFFSKELMTGKGGDAPQHVSLTNDNHLAFLDITGDGYDLSSNGLSGGFNNTMFKSWFWFDRGIYRPNDQIHALWLLRDKEGKPFSKTPVWLKWHRPDGKVVLEKAIKPDASGSYLFDYDLTNTAAMGTWSLEIYFGEGGSLIAQHDVLVDTFLPKQLKVHFDPITKPADFGETTSVIFKGQWLYGADATNLKGSAQWWVTESANPWSALNSWQIGLQNASAVYTERKFIDFQTDDEGSATLDAPLDELSQSTKPLILHIIAGLNEPSGDLTSDQINVPIKREDPYVAIKKLADKQYTVRLVNHDGQAVAGNLNWTLYSKQSHYYWFHNSKDYWDYKVTTTKTIQESGKLVTDPKKDAVLDLKIGDGNWVLENNGDKTDIAGSYNFYTGYWQDDSEYASSDLPPNKLKIDTDKERYQAGDDIHIRIKTPFDGKGSLHLANKGIIASYEFETKDKVATLTIPWQKDWDQGIWLLGTVWNPKLAEQQRDYRAVGLAWIGGAYATHQLDLGITLPENIRSETTLNIPINIKLIDGKPVTSDTWVNVAIVDDGIYQIAKPSFSNALMSFMRKIQLYIKYNDVYGRLIRVIDGKHGELRTGAGGDLKLNSGMSNLPTLDLKLVKFWSKPVKVDASGNATITMDIPRYNGQLRVMATAWSADKLGSFEKTLIVKSPLVVQLSQPLYLAVGDKAPFNIRLHNTTSKPMNITMKLDCNDKTVALGQQEYKMTLDANKDVSVHSPISALNLGRATINVTINYTDEDGKPLVFKDNRFMDIRPTSPTYKQKLLTIVKPGDSFQVTADDKNLQKVDNAGFTLSPGLVLTVKDWVKQLEEYPYGCVEQTTSKAWPLLNVNKLSNKWHFKNVLDTDEIKKRLSEANLKLIDYQQNDGGFGLWNNSDESAWLTAYVTEYWLYSKQLGGLQYDSGLNSSISWLKDYVNDKSFSLKEHQNIDSIIYAQYVLAKAGNNQAEQLLNEGNLISDNITTLNSLTVIHYAGALIYNGKLKEADQLLTKLTKQEFKYREDYYFGYTYGSSLRDLAQSLTVLYQLQKNSNLDGVAKLITKYSLEYNTFINSKDDWLSTQELVWLANLADVVPAYNVPYTVNIAGKDIKTEGGFINENYNDIKVLPLIKNTSDKPLYVYSKWSGLLKPDITIANGFSAKVNYTNLQGDKVDLNSVEINDIIVINFTFSKTYATTAQIMLAQLLPAGFEQEKNLPLPENADDASPNTKAIAPNFSEFRDDRHLAAFDLGYFDTSNCDKATLCEQPQYTYSIIVRAARAGDWVLPGLSLEDMYIPSRRLQLPNQKVHIEAADVKPKGK